MANDPPDRIVPFNLDLVFRRGVGRTLFITFVGLALLPLLLTAWIGYQAAYTLLEQELVQTLEANADLKSHQLESYLNVCLTDAQKQGRLPATLAFFNVLMRRQTAAEESLAEFVQSPTWKTAVATYGSGIQLHADLHGYADILMIDADGGILFSNASETEKTRHKNPAQPLAPPLKGAFRKTLETGEAVFSGFSPAAARTDPLTAFVTAPIGSPEGDPLGVIAIEIPLDIIDQMVETPLELGIQPIVYLLNEGLQLVAGAPADPPPNSIARVETTLTRRWEHHLQEASAISGRSPPLTYRGAKGHLNTGLYAVIATGSSPLALIVEIDRTAALAPLNRLRALLISLVGLVGIGLLVASAALAKAIVTPVNDLTQAITLVAQGDMDGDIVAGATDELDHLAAACRTLVDQFRALGKEHDIQSRFMAGIASLNRLIGGEQELGELCLKTLEFLSDFLDLRQADLFTVNETGGYQNAGHFPGQPAEGASAVIYPGEGRIGQAILQKSIAAFRQEDDSTLITPVPSVDVANLLVVPLVLRQKVNGVLTLEKSSFFTLFDDRYLDAAAEVIAMALGAALTREQEIRLLEQTRQQARKLQAREAALEANTRELQEQSLAFQASEQKLQLKQLELEAANAQMIKNAADLENNMAILEKQKQDMQRQNVELARTHRQLSEKARQLEISSRYKTEFMANMSHELRTPLNSILLLSRLLLENKEQTLTVRQSEFARTINSAGEDLLNLINEILDLAKVESGKMDVDMAPIRIRSIADAMRVSFAPLADQSGVAFSTHVAPEVPGEVVSDRKRIEQIVKNFLSNAFKFTAQGSIRLEIAISRESTHCRGADAAGGCLVISVVDTGIGIPPDKQEIIFEAFQQVDGSTRREYGGTGLGLSISRELARLLGGEISLDSEPGRGSRFALHLPVTLNLDEGPVDERDNGSEPTPIEMAAAPAAGEAPETQSGMEPVPDDRHRLSPGEASILTIDANPATIEPIKAFTHRHGYKLLVAEQIQTGLHFADYYLPMSIFVRLDLPGANGWSIVAQIKANPRCRHIPVFALSREGNDFTAAMNGAAGHIRLPLHLPDLEAAHRRIDKWSATAVRKLLVIDPDPQGSGSIGEVISGATIRRLEASSAKAALALLERHAVNAVILPPELPETDRQRLFTALEQRPAPTFVYPGKDSDCPSGSENVPFAAPLNLKRVDTPDQLLVALAAALHLPPDALGDTHRERLRAIDGRRASLKGRKVLLVDDDMRTVFAVTSALEDQGVEVCTGKTGKESLDKMNTIPDIDLILMDVMIAEVDGYQAIRQIRRRKRYQRVPILALTAKAMQGDRKKCLAAGADDYLAKPVNLDKLTSMLKIWLTRQ